MNSTHLRRVIAAGMIGNVLEWYDFAIYGYFAAQIGRQFFPHEDAVAQLLSTFGIFAVGYLMRPLGGALVGHIGDIFGRRAALTFSVAAMAFPTFLIGLLPGYQKIGLLAPVGLTLLRIVQGLACRIHPSPVCPRCRSGGKAYAHSYRRDNSGPLAGCYWLRRPVCI